MIDPPNITMTRPEDNEHIVAAARPIVRTHSQRYQCD
jgi:hypothetical protein